MTKIAINATDLIGSLAGSKKSASKKPSKPVINDPAINQAIEDFVTASQAAKTAEAQAQTAKAQIDASIGPKRLALCVNNAAVVPSVSVNNRLTFTQMRRWSKVPAEHAAELNEVFGDDADRFFQSTLSIGLSKSSANDEAVLQKLVDALGPEFIGQHFEISRDMEVTEAFHNAWSTDASVQEKAQPFLDSEILRIASSSLKVS